MDQISTAERFPASSNKRTASRRSVQWPARLTWKDQRGAARFASVVARNVSESGVYVECNSVVSIPLYRLVQLQLERDVCQSENPPEALAQGRVLAALYRVSSAGPGGRPQGLALRLMVNPKRRSTTVDAACATA